MGILKAEQIKEQTMNIKEIQELIKFVSKSGVNEVAIEQVDFKITIKTNQPVQAQYLAAPAPQGVTQNITGNTAQVVEPVAEIKKPVEDDSKLLIIRSPMIGTFYRTTGPDKPPFISVGDEINVGKVVCIIEAMKLFNDIESEISGRIVKILVENASPVEYDQPLFLVELL